MNEIGMQIFTFFIELAGIRQLSEFITALDGLDQATKEVFQIIGVITCIFGLLQCFFGYKLFKFWCGVVGLLLGCSLGLALATSGVFSGSPAANLIALLLLIILGITGAFIAYRAYLVGLFIYAFSVAFLVGFILFALITDSIIVGLGVGIAAGIALGVVAVIYRRLWIIITTCVSGGIAICSGMMMALMTTELGWVFLLPPVFVVAGFFVQNITVKKGGKKSGQPQVTVVVPPVYPSEAPPVYPQQAPQTGYQPAQPQAQPPVVPAPVQEINPVQSQAEVAAAVNACQNCGSPVDNTAPCNNCGSAVHVSN